MRKRRGAKRETWSPLMVAGWLFADLAMALVVILIAATATVSAKAEETEPESSKPTQDETEDVPMGIDPKSEKFDVEYGSMKSGMRKELRELEKDGRKAALVLTFGVTPSDTGAGVNRAKKANKALKKYLPDLMDKAVTRNYWSSGPSGTVEFEVFLFLEK